MNEIVAFINAVSSTDKILSIILVYFSMWVFPRHIWPAWKDSKRNQIEREYDIKMSDLARREKEDENQLQREYDIKMSDLARREKADERWIEMMEKIAEAQRHTHEELTILNERMCGCHEILLRIDKDE